LLPSVVLHDDFIEGLPATSAAFWENMSRDVPRGTRWSWLLTLCENAINAPGGLEWDDPPSKLDVAVDTTSVTFCAASGYAFVLAVPSPGFSNTGVLQLVQHVASGWTRVPCVGDLVTEAQLHAAGRLTEDAAVSVAWRPSSTIELSHGRAGLFYRFVAPPYASGGGTSFLVARTRLASNDADYDAC